MRPAARLRRRRVDARWAARARFPIRRLAAAAGLAVELDRAVDVAARFRTRPVDRAAKALRRLVAHLAREAVLVRGVPAPRRRIATLAVISAAYAAAHRTADPTVREALIEARLGVEAGVDTGCPGSG